MKAIVYRKFGSTDVLEYGEINQPKPAADGIVVKVRAASLNVIDSRSRRGEMSPFVNKKFPKIPGVDFAGVVSQVGHKVTDLRPGDEVLGAVNPFRGGGLAEYVSVARKAVTHKPSSLTWADSAAIPLAGVSALLSLRDLCRVQPRQNVLIHGSSGGLGTFAVQLAQILGATVTGVSGPAGVSLTRDLGAVEAYDYTFGDLQTGKRFDAILNFSGAFPFERARPFLTERGRFVEPSPTIPRFIFSMIANLFRKQKQLMLTAQIKTEDLDSLTKLVVEGRLRPVIARVLPFHEAIDAFRLFEKGGVQGKVVIEFA